MTMKTIHVLVPDPNPSFTHKCLRCNADVIIVPETHALAATAGYTPHDPYTPYDPTALKVPKGYELCMMRNQPGRGYPWV